MKKLQLVILIQAGIAAVMLLDGCASSSSAQSFQRAATRTTFDVYYGEVVSMRIVEIEGESSGLGRFSGGMIGAAIGLGDSQWYSQTRHLESAVGAVGGAIAGEAIERRVTRDDGFEILVRLDHDETIAVVQATDVQFFPGERVQVLIGRDGTARIQQMGS